MMRFLSISNLFSRRRSEPKPADKVSFQVLSDLHLEVGQQYSTFDFPTTAPNLILAGDIGRLSDYEAYVDFVAKQTARYERVFLVLGNHDFHGLDFTTALSMAKKLEREPRLQGKMSLLHQTRVDLPDGVTVMGCTLWSHVPDEAARIVREKVKDYRNIRGWTVDRHNEAHRSDLDWLQSELAGMEPGRSVLVVTHHAPSVPETSRPEQIQNPWTSAFATDIISSDGEKKNGKVWDSVKYWAFGHTHHSTEFEQCGIRVVSNQRGYVIPGKVDGKGGDERFDAAKTIEVPVGASENVR